MPTYYPLYSRTWAQQHRCTIIRFSLATLAFTCVCVRVICSHVCLHTARWNIQRTIILSNTVHVQVLCVFVTSRDIGFLCRSSVVQLWSKGCTLGEYFCCLFIFLFSFFFFYQQVLCFEFFNSRFARARIASNFQFLKTLFLICRSIFLLWHLFYVSKY